MLNKIYSKKELTAFLTRELLENNAGVIIDEAMPQDSYIAIDIDEYYHRVQSTAQTSNIGRRHYANKSPIIFIK